MKCVKCDKEAKWTSTEYDSPLCTDCAHEFIKAKEEADHKVYLLDELFERIPPSNIAPKQSITLYLKANKCSIHNKQPK